MARTTKTGIDYFSHDVDMMQDKKVKILKAKHGLVGYAIYMRLLEELYRENGYYINVDEDFNILFADDNNIDFDVYIEILNVCINKGLFNKKLYNTYGILTSERIQNNYCDATERRKVVAFIKEYLLIDVNSKYNIEKVNVCINSLNVDIGTQSKVKESKVKKSKYGDFVYLTDDEHGKLVEKFGNGSTKSRIENLDNYIGSTGKKYKSHYHTILNWARKESPVKSGSNTIDTSKLKRVNI